MAISFYPKVFGISHSAVLLQCELYLGKNMDLNPIDMKNNDLVFHDLSQTAHAWLRDILGLNPMK